MMKRMFSFILLLVLLSCSESKYLMPNVLNGEYIDVSNYVKKGYKPVYESTNNKIVSKLIKPNVNNLDKELLLELEKEVNLYLKKQVLITNSAILYRYSYIISFELVDVYSMEIPINNRSNKIFFRVKNNKLILPLNDEGWVL